MDALVAWRSNAGWAVFVWSLASLLVIDLGALAAAPIARDRTLVNRWTGRVLTANVCCSASGPPAPRSRSLLGWRWWLFRH